MTNTAQPCLTYWLCHYIGENFEHGQDSLVEMSISNLEKLQRVVWSEVVP